MLWRRFSESLGGVSLDEWTVPSSKAAPSWDIGARSSSRPELLNHSKHVVTTGVNGGEGDVGLNGILTVCCSHCHCSRQSVMAIGQSWLADDDGYDTSTPYYHSSVYGWYNGFV